MTIKTDDNIIEYNKNNIMNDNHIISSFINTNNNNN